MKLMGYLFTNFFLTPFLFFVILYSNVSESQIQLMPSNDSSNCGSNELKLSQNVEDIFCHQFKESGCEDYLAKLDVLLRDHLTPKKCLPENSTLTKTQNKSSESEITENLLFCSPIVLALAHKKIGNMIPKTYFFGSEYIQKILISKGYKSIGNFITAGSFIITTKILIQNLLESLDTEKSCQSPEKNQNLMVTLKKVDDDLQKQLTPFVSQEELRHIAFPELYTERNFVENLTCQKIKEIIQNQKKKYDVILGPLLAQNKISTDPRNSNIKNRPSIQDINTVDDLKKHWSCFKGDSAIKITCLIANLSLSGKAFTSIYRNSVMKVESSVVKSNFVQKYMESKSIQPLTSSDFKELSVDRLYQGENKVRVEYGEIKQVHYFSETEKLKHTIQFKNGRAYHIDSNPISTNTELTTSTKPIPGIFVIDLQGRLILAPRKQFGKLHHSSLSAGEPVMMAGEIVIRNGEIISIVNRSGHFKPKSEHIEFTKKYLEINGVDTSKIKFSNFTDDK